MICLGIDVGSTSIKGALLDLDAGCVGEVHSRPFPDRLLSLPADRHEVSADAVVSETLELIEQLAATAKGIRAVFFSTQMGGVVLADGAGRPISNYISWRDQRSLAPCDGASSYLAAAQRQVSAQQYAQVGRELKPGSATSLLFWLARNRQLPAHATAMTLGAHVISRITGSAPRVEPTDPIGALDVTTHTWHHGVFAALGLPDELHWPRVQSYREPCGQVTVGHEQLTCHPAVGDQPCALRGVGLGQQQLSINVSTGSQVSLVTDTARLGEWQTRCGFDGQYLNTITHLPAGRSLNVLVDLLTELSPSSGDPWPRILSAVERAEETELEVDLAFFDSPVGQRGAIRNITVENLSIGNLFLAALRNMADNYQLCAERLRAADDWDEVILSGGLTRNMPRLQQFIQQRFACPVRERGEHEDVLTGLLRLAELVYNEASA